MLRKMLFFTVLLALFISGCGESIQPQIEAVEMGWEDDNRVTTRVKVSNPKLLSQPPTMVYVYSSALQIFQPSLERISENITPIDYDVSGDNVIDMTGGEWYLIGVSSGYWRDGVWEATLKFEGKDGPQKGGMSVNTRVTIILFSDEKEVDRCTRWIDEDNPNSPSATEDEKCPSGEINWPGVVQEKTQDHSLGSAPSDSTTSNEEDTEQSTIEQPIDPTNCIDLKLVGETVYRDGGTINYAIHSSIEVDENEHCYTYFHSHSDADIDYIYFNILDRSNNTSESYHPEVLINVNGQDFDFDSTSSPATDFGYYCVNNTPDSETAFNIIVRVDRDYTLVVGTTPNQPIVEAECIATFP